MDHPDHPVIYLTDRVIQTRVIQPRVIQPSYTTNI